MKVSIIIPSWNGKDLLAKNIPCVTSAAQNYGLDKVEILVVDDNSTDNSDEYIKEHFPEIKILRLSKHSGFAKACNEGVKKSSGEIIILLNNDAVPDGDFIASLISHFSDSQVFAVGSLEKSVREGKEITSGRSIGWFEKGLVWHQRAKEQTAKDQASLPAKQGPMTTFWVAGGSGAFRKSLWEKFGGFDPIFSPFYWEDIDLSYRALKCGYKLIFEPKSMVTHQHETTIKKEFGEKDIKIISTKNQILFVWKNISDRKMLLSHFLWLKYHVVANLIHGNPTFLLGLIGAIKQLPEVIRQRKLTSKNWVKRDKELLSRLTI